MRAHQVEWRIRFSCLGTCLWFALDSVFDGPAVVRLRALACNPGKIRKHDFDIFRRDALYKIGGILLQQTLSTSSFRRLHVAQLRSLVAAAPLRQWRAVEYSTPANPTLGLDRR